MERAPEAREMALREAVVGAERIELPARHRK